MKIYEMFAKSTEQETVNLLKEYRRKSSANKYARLNGRPEPFTIADRERNAHSEWFRFYRQHNKKRCNSYSKRWKEKNNYNRSKNKAMLNKLYKKKHPRRAAIYEKLQRAVKSGAIRKPKRCELCGRKRILEGHHYDYDKPIDVIWFCLSCHRGYHAAEHTINELQKQPLFRLVTS